MELSRRPHTSAPGVRPRRPAFQTLATAWARAVGRPFSDVERDLEVGRFTPPGDVCRMPRVLVIDQLEEIFTHCRDSEERRLFTRALSGSPHAPGTRSVLGLRADYLRPDLQDPRLDPIVSTGQFPVAVMNDETNCAPPSNNPLPGPDCAGRRPAEAPAV
ncbi:hypothetical protein [Streptomyces sp. NPDC088760]|uniref:nSTAND1 domain-containing NTPase n=1 Tax=Streptomyces sp. NPDC088760 TaxID=3365890 RepID=UPI0037F3B743